MTWKIGLHKLCLSITDIMVFPSVIQNQSGYSQQVGGGGGGVPSTVFSLCDTEVEGYIQGVGGYPVQCFLSVIQK